jgi:hypothetical protein
MGVFTFFFATVLATPIISQRVLLALASSLVVAIAEGGLFILWRLRQDAPETRRKSRAKVHTARHKKTDDDADEADETRNSVAPQQSSEQSTSPTNSLRQRRL